MRHRKVRLYSHSGCSAAAGLADRCTYGAGGGDVSGNAPDLRPSSSRWRREGPVVDRGRFRHHPRSGARPDRRMRQCRNARIARTAMRGGDHHQALGASRARMSVSCSSKRSYYAVAAGAPFVADLVLRWYAHFWRRAYPSDPSGPEVRNGVLRRAAGGRCRGDPECSRQSCRIARAATPDQWRRRCNIAVQRCNDG
jgi:hypothetical protein